MLPKFGHPIGIFVVIKEKHQIFSSIYYVNENYKSLREGIVVAIPKKNFVKNKDTIRGCIENLRLKIDKSSISEIERKWTPSRKFPNRIEDMNVQELESIVFNN